MKRELLRVQYKRPGIDRSKWPPGPWDDEPDLIEWKDEHTGYPCMVMRSDFSGGLCGYVGVWPSHPHYGAENSAGNDGMDDIPVQVHGGLTFAGLGILHDDGRPLLCWALGFDCSHAFDDTPWMAGMMSDRLRFITRHRLVPEGRYWRVEAVMYEVERLAEQLYLLELAGGGAASCTASL